MFDIFKKKQAPQVAQNYKVIAVVRDITAFEYEVNKAIAEGWEPIGGIGIKSSGWPAHKLMFFQGMRRAGGEPF